MITFSSKHSGPVVMLNADGKRLLRIIGKLPDDARGLITPEQIADAITALEDAAAAEAQAWAEARAAAAAEKPAEQPHDATDEPPPVSLGQRAFPLLEMLKRANEGGEPVLWGV